jgi:hypothetical protein
VNELANDLGDYVHCDNIWGQVAKFSFDGSVSKESLWSMDKLNSILQVSKFSPDTILENNSPSDIDLFT